MERKVVITGMGIWSCLGKTLEEVRDSLYTGKSGIVYCATRQGVEQVCGLLQEAGFRDYILRRER